MKYRYLIIAYLLVFCLNSYSQNELTFKVRYSPETTYSQTIVQTSESNMTFIGSEEFLQKLKDKGVQNPMVTNTSTTSEMDFKTGKLDSHKYFPLTMEFVKTTNSNGKKIIPDGTMIYGHGTLENMPELDSIVSEGLDNEFKKGLLHTLKSTFSQISFPIKKLKVGDSFSQESPLSIPVAGTTVEMAIVTNYKLISILNNLGNFDVTQTYTMRSTISNNDITAAGSGIGKIVYDIKNNFLLKFQTTGELEMNMKIKEFSINLKSKNGYDQTVIIRK